MLVITSVAAAFLPRQRLHFYNLFRLAEALQLLALNAGLVVAGLDGADTLHTGARVTLAACRLAHAKLNLDRFGPTAGDCTGLPGLVRNWRSHECDTDFERLPSFAVWLAAGMALLPQLFASTRSSFGEAALLGPPLVAMEAASGVTVMLKWLLLLLLIPGKWTRSRASGLVGVLALAQWTVMQRVFARAPLPSVYLLIPAYMLASALAFHAAWLRDPSDRAGLERIAEDAEDNGDDVGEAQVGERSEVCTAT